MKRLILTVLLISVICDANPISRGVERNSEAFALFVLPYIEISKPMHIKEAVDFVNFLITRADPPPPKDWRIYLDDSYLNNSNTKVIVVGENMQLYEVISSIAKQIEADIVINKSGYVLIPSKTNQNK